MKFILPALVALALVNGHKAQLHQLTGPPPDGLPTDPTIKPATQCGQTALTCYTDESKNGGLNTMLAQLKFAEGCRLVLVVMKCMDAEASKTECSGDAALTDIATVRQWALDDIDDICHADGSVTGCGADAESCIRDVMEVVVALSLHNISTTCPLFGRYKTCKDYIQAATECNTKVNAFLDQAEAKMSEYQMISGCEGKCAQHIGLCTVNSTAFSMDYGTEKYCSDAKSMIDCVNALKANTDCKDTSDENQISEVDQAVAAQTALASDVCTDDFQVAPCATHLIECYTELIRMTQDKTISNFDFCKKASQFEECARTLGCENQLKNAAQTMKGKVMVLEEKYGCAYEGDCSDRLDKCAQLAVPLESVTKDAPISEICKILQSGMDCLDMVKKDDTCIIERAAVQVIEDKFTPDNKTVCGSGGGATSVTTDWQTSNTTTTTAPTTSVQRYYQCHVDSVDLAIPVSVVPNSKLHLKESSCQLQNNGTHHVLSFGYQECGTSVAYYTDYVYATNDITVESTLPPNGLVVFADDYTIPLECRFHHEQFVNGAFQAVAIDSTILGRRGGADAADFILREFRTELYQDVITEYPAQIPLNKELFVEIALANANGGTTGIVVKECKATPSNDDKDNNTYTLIQDGCPAQPTVQLQPNPHNETFRFSLQAFHFANPVNQNNMVYLHCDVSICPVTSCTSNCAATKRRRRRSIAQLVDTVTVSSGPYLLV